MNHFYFQKASTTQSNKQSPVSVLQAPRLVLRSVKLLGLGENVEGQS